jgi:NADH-quinone oxidoreductase subunit N
VPFHEWAPDVYQGAPTPVTGFMVSAVKAAGFAALLRVFVVTFPTYSEDWKPIIWVLAVLTLLVGSVLALVQTDVKRILAYSSIVHAGYVLVAVQAGSPDGVSAALFYLFTYSLTAIGSFAVVTLVGRTGDGRHGIEMYRGLSRSRPLLALILTVLLLSQAGIPLTSGFVAKFEVIAAADDAHSYALSVIAMLVTAISIVVYLRVIIAMYMSDAQQDQTIEPVRVPIGAGLVLVMSVGFTVVVGFIPEPLVEFAQYAVPRLVAPS